VLHGFRLWASAVVWRQSRTPVPWLVGRWRPTRLPCPRNGAENKAWPTQPDCKGSCLTACAICPGGIQLNRQVRGWLEGAALWWQNGLRKWGHLLTQALMAPARPGPVFKFRHGPGRAEGLGKVARCGGRQVHFLDVDCLGVGRSTSGDRTVERGFGRTAHGSAWEWIAGEYGPHTTLRAVGTAGCRCFLAPHCTACAQP